ncbi:MAG: hypothetical protein LBV55_04095 [Acholeplasmatales bacterium]|jgi:predicted O-methyltransferase YrrM|nr:hypothetical protein [Acholeplasmatales bacterium]
MISAQIRELAQISKDLKIPLISLEVGEFLLNTLASYSSPKVLEIGSGIGFSSFLMSTQAKLVYTIEKDPERYEKLRLLMPQFQIDNVIAINADALAYHLDETLKFEVIFIDAAKSKYQEYFEKYAPYLTANGCIISDNMFFHHLQPQLVSKNTKKLLLKLQNYRQFLQDHPTFKTQILAIGDGLAVSVIK